MNNEVYVKPLIKYKHLVAYVIISVVFLLRQWAIVGKPYLWAEDGAIFIARAGDGLNAFITPYAGYYHFISQFLVTVFWGFCTIINNITLLPYMMWASAAIIETLILFYFTSDKFSWILPERKNRIIAVCIVILLQFSEIGEVYGCVTNLQWWFGYFFWLVGLQMFHERKFPNAKITAICVSFGFSTPGVVPLFVMFGLLAVYKIIYHKLKRYDITKIMIASVPFIIQLWSVLNSSRIKTEQDFGEKIRVVVDNFNSLISKLVIPSSINLYEGRRALIFGVILIIGSWIILRTKRNFTGFSIFYAFAYLAFCMFPLILSNAQNRYGFVTIIVIATLFAVAVVELKHFKTAAICIIVIVCTERFNIGFDTASTDYWKEASPLFQHKGDANLVIRTHPSSWGMWTVNIPIMNYDEDTTKKQNHLVFAVDRVNNVPPNEVVVRGGGGGQLDYNQWLGF